MPIRWYIWSVIGFVAWGVVLVWIATEMPGLPRLYELAGVLLTLLPVMLDLLRKYYIHTHGRLQPSGDAESGSLDRLREALLGYEPLFALMVLLGVSLIILGVAMDVARGPEMHGATG